MLGQETQAAGKAGKEYVCDCERHCKGHQKKVSRSTYQRHAPYRKSALSKRLQLYVPGTVANQNNLSPDGREGMLPNDNREELHANASQNHLSPDGTPSHRREGVSFNDTPEELHANSTQFEAMVPGAVCDLDAELQLVLLTH